MSKIRATGCESIRFFTGFLFFNFLNEPTHVANETLRQHVSTCGGYNSQSKKKKKKEKGCGINLRNTVLFLSTTIKTWQRATEGAAACRSAALIWTNLLSKLNYEFLMSLITEH